MPKFDKPPEGSWTQHYPQLGTGPISYEDSISPEYYELERRGDLRADLAQRRAGRAAPAARELLHQGSRRRQHVADHRARPRRRGPRVPQHLPPPRQQARVAGLPATRRPRASAASSRASTTAGGTTSTARCTFVQQEGEFFDLDKADYGLVPVHCRRVGRVHLRQPRPGDAADRCATTSARSAPASTATRSAR